MSYAAMDFLIEKSNWIAQKELHFVPLVRNPHHSIISLYKKKRAAMGEKNLDILIKKNDFITRTGYKSLYELFQLIKEHTQNPIHFIVAEAAIHSPQKNRTLIL